MPEKGIKTHYYNSNLIWRKVSRFMDVIQYARSSYCYNNLPAHQIRISEIVAWDGKSYPTQAILPRLSRESYIHWLFWNSRTWS